MSFIEQIEESPAKLVATADSKFDDFILDLGPLSRHKLNYIWSQSPRG